MAILLKYMRNLISLILILMVFSCGLYRKTDLREVPVNVDDRAAKDIAEGKSLALVDAFEVPVDQTMELYGDGGGTFNFNDNLTLSGTLKLNALNNTLSNGTLIINNGLLQLDENTTISMQISLADNASMNLASGMSDAAVGLGTTAQAGANPGLLGATGSAAQQKIYNVGQGMRTDDAEDLGTSGDNFNEMAFSIEKVTVTAKSRALKAEYSLELAQDLKAIHGLNAEAELANILSTEILAEINREVIRTIYNVAEPGAQANVASAGTFDLDTDSNGRWSVEKFKGLIFQMERDANAIAQRTRRGKGNMILCSADVASALTMAGVLDYTPALNANLNVDDTGNTFAGVLQGKYRVYIDPFAANVAATQYYVMGYKGSSPYDAGLFYCPYVPLQMVRAVGQDTFQPKIGFKTRYGMVENPFSQGLTQGLGTLTRNTNRYYRRVKVTKLM